MTEEIGLKRPRWLKILIGILSAWVAFILSMIVLLAITLMIQNFLNDIVIEDTSAIILLLLGTSISAYVVFRFTKWQTKFLDKRDAKTFYVVLTILIIITIMTLPIPMTYIIF
ncbi:MAG: hypothetical protein K8R41_02220 [Bacteroidales bacterium]|nr:hypothetical protein [Bacteroidales bacterium]